MRVPCVPTSDRYCVQPSPAPTITLNPSVTPSDRRHLWAEPARLKRQLPAAPVSPQPGLDLRPLSLLQKRPAAALMHATPLPLAAYALDMAYPPSLRTHARTQCQKVLKAMNRADLDPDNLILKVFSRVDPLIAADGSREYTRHISMTQLALLSLAEEPFDDLSSAIERYESNQNDPLATVAEVLVKDHQYGHVAGVGMTCAGLFEAVRKTAIKVNYSQRLKAFWHDQGPTYRALAKLAYADALAQQVEQHQLTLQGQALALRAAGLTAGPPSYRQLHESLIADDCYVTSLRLQGRVIPGIMEIRSRNEPCTLIYIPGREPAFMEFSTPARAEAGFNRLLENPKARNVLTPYLNAVLDRPSHPDDASTLATAPGLFQHLSANLLRNSLRELDSPDTDTPLEQPVGKIFQPIERSLAMLASAGSGAHNRRLLKQVPSAKLLAARYMRHTLLKHYPVALDANRTFIQYLPGRRVEQAPFLLPKTIKVPDTQPISLTQALLDNYRVAEPVGYKEYGGRTVIFSDTTGRGIYSPAALLPIEPELIARLAEEANFSRTFNHQVARFWRRHSGSVARSLKETFNTDAIDSLAANSLSAHGLTMLLQALDTAPATRAAVSKHALGFKIDDSTEQTSAGLIQFSRADTALTVLYQPGTTPPFMEFANQAGLHDYIEKATLDPTWRQTFLRHVAQRHHAKTALILDIWAGKQSPAPASLLRPWTAQVYQSHLHAAQRKILSREKIPGDLVSFMTRSLRNNSLDDAQQSITTTGQLRRQAWNASLETLQLLLTPLALAFPVAAAGLLAVGGSRLAINLYTALAPESTATDRERALTNVALGSLDLLPAAPRIATIFKKLTHASKLRGPARHSVPVPKQRTTLRETFFTGTAMMKTWSSPATPPLGGESVKAWKLGQNFLLWTGEKTQARTLIVSTHGGYLPWASSEGIAIPNGTRLKVYGPHGHTLADPLLSRVAIGKVKPYATLDTLGNTAESSALRPGVSPPTDKSMSGTQTPGRIRNYSLGKFQQKTGVETYEEVSSVVRNIRLGKPNNSPLLTPMDVLTVRNRLSPHAPTLDDLFKQLSERGIHYDEIHLLHCRGPVFNCSPPSFSAA